MGKKSLAGKAGGLIVVGCEGRAGREPRQMELTPQGPALCLVHGSADLRSAHEAPFEEQRLRLGSLFQTAAGEGLCSQPHSRVSVVDYLFSFASHLS